MLADLDDFQCEPDQLGRFEISPDLQRCPELGLALGLMGFTPIKVEFGDPVSGLLDVVGLSPLFVAVPKGAVIPVYEFKIVWHEGDDMIDPSINCPVPYVIELHLGES